MHRVLMHDFFDSKFLSAKIKARDLRETIESGPLCITDLFQNRSVAYFKSIFIYLRIFILHKGVLRLF